MADNGVSPNLGDGIDVHVVDVAAAAVGEGVQPVLARHSTTVGAADGLRPLARGWTRGEKGCAKMATRRKRTSSIEERSQSDVKI
jgi:hypothetical protein